MSSMEGFDKEKEVIEAFFRAAANADISRIRAFVSKSFHINSGMNADEYIRYEIDQFAKFSSWLSDGVNVLIDKIDYDRSRRRAFFSIVDDCGGLIFQGTIYLDDDCLITSNESYVEAVPKFHFYGANERKISIAARSPRGKIVFCRTPFPERGVKLYNGANFDKDGFFVIEINDHETKPITGDLDPIDVIFYIDTGTAIEKHHETVFIRGMDRRFFRSMMPSIMGNKIEIPCGMRVWSIFVETETGETSYIENPMRSSFDFSSNVRKCILTDALDNDWEAIANE